MTKKIDNEGRWLAAALAIASFYSALALRLAFRAPNLVQDDARQHVFWMQRFIDPSLFPHDLIADYFQAVAPAGYKFTYWIFASCGVDPFVLARIVPAVIGILTAYLAFRLFVRLMPDARGAFFASVLLCQIIWLEDDVISATPRAFVYPLFLGFLLCLHRRAFVAGLFVLALEGLFYPQAAFVSAGVLVTRLLRMKDRHLYLTRDRADYVVAIAGALVVAAVLIPFASAISKCGPVITAESARAVPEFLQHGRSQFFTTGLGFWINGPRSGLLPNAIPVHIAILAIAGTWFLYRKFPALGALLLQIALVAVAMWAAAHLFLFKLHLPGRYSQWVFRIVIAMTAASALALILDAAQRWKGSRLFGWLFIFVVILAFPHFTGNFPRDSYLRPKSPPLYDFLRSRPKSNLIATLKEEANLIPVFAQRPVLVSAEYAIPYHQSYYGEIRQRGQDLVRAHRTSDPQELRAFIEKYHVDLMIVGRAPVTARYIKHLRWFREIAPPAADERPVLPDFIARCKIWEDKRNIVLDAHSIVEIIGQHETSPSY